MDGVQLSQAYRDSLRRKFTFCDSVLGKADQCCLCQSIMSHHAKMFLKNSVTDDDILGWIVLDRIRLKFSFSLERVFLTKLTSTAITYLLYPIMLNVSKNR